MRILENRFCGLSRAKNFQSFLKNLDGELYQELINHLQLNEGCKSNSKKMRKIYHDIKSRGKEQQLIDFISDRYPHMIVKGNNDHNAKITNKDANIKNDRGARRNDRGARRNEVRNISAATPNQLLEKMNYHKVFDIYRPRVFFIPQRKIIVGPTKKHVSSRIARFSAGKLDVDYIILQGPELWHGYVEYFEPRFKDKISQIDHSQRPIARYKKLNGL